ncbi:polyprenol phosphomannose-dependent alpha 1,6 mannosyltransferase MptB [Micromonospora sp. LOL_024]|uniref:polyprenol phosphomannose-dependent alpha 1,6 mannosyltransferase MptB n=1 Tax=Micromonospora sp. LOL_024 TaxID=3345412 RepID=UPI003A85A1F6
MTVPGARLARYGGLAGALLLAVAGYLGGALPGTATVRVWHSGDGPLTVALWLLGTAAMVAAWWSLRDGAPSTRWAYVTAGSWTLPLLLTAPLGSRDVYSYACQGWVYADGGDPYATGAAAAGCPWVEAVAPVWRDTPAPYGPFFVLLAALAVLLGGGLVGAVVLLRSLAVAGLLLVACCLPGLARAAGTPTRRVTWLVLACPLVGVHLVAGAHNDAVMLGLLLLGLLLLVRRPVAPVGSAGPGPVATVGVLLAAGVLLGLAVSVKATAVVVLPFVALVAVRGRLTVPALLRDGGTLAGGVLGGLVASSLLSGLGLGWLGGLDRSGDTEQWTSPPTAVGMVVDYAGELVGRQPGAVPVARVVGLVVLAGLLAMLWWRTWSAVRGRYGSVESGRTRLTLLGAGLALALTVALAPVFHPWYATWPLVLLAVTATRTAWFVVPGAVAAFLALPDGTNLARLAKAPGAVAMTVLVIAVAVWAQPRLRRQLRRHPPSSGRAPTTNRP